MGVTHALKTFFMGAPIHVSLTMDPPLESEGIREQLRQRELAARRKVIEAETKLKEAISTLDREREQLKAIFDAMPQCVYVSDMRTHEIYYANPSVLTLHGDVVGQKCYEALHGRSAPCGFCNNPELLEGLGPKTWELYHEGLDKHFKITNTVIEWPDVGKVRLEIATDVTEIQESHTRNAALLAAMPDMMFVLDREGTYIDFHAENGNRNELTICPGCIVGSKLSDANFPPHSVSFILEKIEEALNTGNVVSFEYDLETPIGHQYYEARMVAFREDQVLATVRNISDRRQRETALQQRQTEAEILAEVTECAVIFHRHNEVFLVNPAFTRLTGYTKEDLDGVEDLTATLFAPHCCDMIRDMIDAQSTKPYRAIMLSKEGDEFEVSIKPHYRPYNGNPEPVRIAVIVAPDIVVDEERNCD